MAQVSLVPRMKRSFQGFSPDALAFLRSLKRNNRREWFQPRKEKYEALIKEPMLELIGCLNEEFARFAPEYITPPQKRSEERRVGKECRSRMVWLAGATV